MIERDDELRESLRQWRAPDAPDSLDDRVWSSFHANGRGSDWKRWALAAAGIVLAVGLAGALLQRPGRDSGGKGPHREPELATTLSAAGYVPLDEGRIVTTNGIAGAN